MLPLKKCLHQGPSIGIFTSVGCGFGVRRVSGDESLVQLRRLTVNYNVRFDSGHKGRRTEGNGFGLEEARVGFAVGGARFAIASGE